MQSINNVLGLTSGTKMKGLNDFISDIRGCKNKEAENKRVEQQLANIRQKFSLQRGLNAYQRKKYVWKLLYIHILGYEVDFGFQQAAGLINASKYDEKYTGYIASSLLISEKNDNIWKSIVHSISADILSKNQAAQALAFSMIASILPDLIVTQLSEEIVQSATNSKNSASVRRKAIICLARIIRKNPSNYDIKSIIPKCSAMFDMSRSLSSFHSASASLLLTLMSTSNPDNMKQIQPKVIRRLHGLVIGKDCPADYLYYNTPNPWLQMKLYKALQIWSIPESAAEVNQVTEIITTVLKKTGTSKSVNRNNTEYGLLFQNINLVIQYDSKIDQKLINDVSKILLAFISSSQPNIRYLGLEAMCRLAIKHDMSIHQTKIIPNLDDNDISIRRRALDLLYLICNPQNATTIVAQLLGYLENRNDPLMVDDLVLKIAILAQKFAQNPIWYVDVVVKLIQNAQVENDIWFRIVQLISGFGQANQQLQHYATIKLYSCLILPHVTQTLKCVGSYITAQFSDYLVKNGKDPKKIFEAINKHYQTSSNKSKAMMLNSFAKLGVKYPILKQQVEMIFHLSSQHWDPDVQQRGVEFLALFSQDNSIKDKIITLNPVFTQQQQQTNPLLKKFSKSMRKTIHDSKAKKISNFNNSANIQSNIATSHPLANHPCFKKAIDRLSPTLVNLVDLPEKLDVKPYWKEALTKKTAFDNCEIKDKIEDEILKISLTVHVQTTQMQVKIYRSKGLQVSIAPIKYGPQSQQIMMIMTPNGERIQPPMVGVAWKNNGKILKKQLQLPITISRFMNAVQVTYDKFQSFYKQYSLPNNKFYKLDAMLKLPDGMKSQEYLRKIGSFLNSICNFKCSGYPSLQTIKLIYGCSSYVLKEGDKKISYPILIEIETYIDKIYYARFSLRGGNGRALQSIFQIIALFFT